MPTCLFTGGFLVAFWLLTGNLMDTNGWGLTMGRLLKLPSSWVIWLTIWLLDGWFMAASWRLHGGFLVLCNGPTHNNLNPDYKSNPARFLSPTCGLVDVIAGWLRGLLLAGGMPLFPGNGMAAWMLLLAG